MADFNDVERLRKQNVSLLRKLQENQNELKYSVKSTRDLTSSSDAKLYSAGTSSHEARGLGYLPARSSSPPTRDCCSLPDRSFITSPRHALATSAEQITSTPKHKPINVQPSLLKRASMAQASPMHRSRTEILDTAPQELLSASCNTDGSRCSYTSRLGPRQDDSFFHKRSTRASAKDDGFFHKVSSRASAQKTKMLARKEQRRLSAREKLSVRTRRSPRNVSTVSAPGAKASQNVISNSARRKQRVLNDSVQNLQRGVAPRQQRVQSAMAPELSPWRQRYNLRRPGTATPKFRRSRELERQSPQKMPSRYESEFLNAFYGKMDQENVGDITVQRSHFSGRLLDDGNARTSRRQVLDTTPKPKSILLTPANKSVKGKNSMHVSFLDSPNATSTSMRHDELDSSSGHVQPLLGYDWIAGLLDTDGQVSQRTEGHLAELQEFRQNNYEDCVHKSMVEEPDAAESSFSHHSKRGPPDDEVPGKSNKTHKCIHNYTLNDRLFPVPLHGTKTGESLCALCNARRPIDSSVDSPSYVRVSVPRSTLRSPYQVRPHRRKSFDPTDSIGLSQHCLAGWENSLPSMMPAASNIDLKDSLGYTISQSQSLFMDREDVTGQPPRTRRPLVPSTETQQLLNRSRSMRLELQKLERAGLPQVKAADTTQYPVL